MRIAQVAPLSESVPPMLYGGTERVVANLTDELVRQGHSVTLFASGDSVTAATLVPIVPTGLRLAGCVDMLAPHVMLVEAVASCATAFDVIHFHIAQLHCPVMRRLGTPHLTTAHGRLDLPELQPFYRMYWDMPLVSISNAQRRPLHFANWIGTVYHGLPSDALTFRQEPEGYLAFLGRISPEKRVDRAIAIARACRRRLRIAAKVDPADQQYFESTIRPLLDDPLVEYIGEIGDREKSDFLGKATALLFPIDWPEPFGLVMIEALGCGTPVVAFRGGSVPEIIEHGVTGFVVDTIDQAIEATRQIHRLNRRDCRDAFEQRFTVARMAEQYVELYKRAGERHRSIAVA
jgi:glycosyltransferase involved in cell wall biosynthesis